MAVEAGLVARGSVVHLMPYGALVRLEDGTTGLVHISEIDSNFVHNVGDLIQKGDTVIVKVLASGEKGKTELSIKQAKGLEVNFTPPVVEVTEEDDSRPAPSSAPSGRRESRGVFEEKMREFLTNSSDRLTDVRKHTDSKLGKRGR